MKLWLHVNFFIKSWFGLNKTHFIESIKCKHEFRQYVGNSGQGKYAVFEWNDLQRVSRISILVCSLSNTSVMNSESFANVLVQCHCCFSSVILVLPANYRFESFSFGLIHCNGRNRNVLAKFQFKSQLGSRAIYGYLESEARWKMFESIRWSVKKILALSCMKLRDCNSGFLVMHSKIG